MLTFEEARKLYESHVMNRRLRLKQLLNAYKGNHDILRKANRKGKKDAKIVHNFPRYISTIVTGYTGNVNYTKMEDVQDLSDIFSFNSEPSVNSDHLLFMSIYGESYELQWLDEQGKYCFEAVDPMNVMVITDGKIRESVTDAIVFDEDDLKGNKIKVTMTVYDDTSRRVYSYTRTKSSFNTIKSEINVSSFVEEYDEPHKIGACPVIQFKNNRWEQGDFEPIVTMNDAYNLSVSNSVNDLTDNTDAMMVFRNLNATTPEDIRQAKANGGFKVNDGGDVTWLVKNINDAYAENIKNRLDSDIHKLSFVPDMSDQNFANNASGVAIRYKLLGLEQIRLEKVKWMKKALFKRLQMISGFLSTKSKVFDPLTIGITFKANLPQNSQEIAQFVQMLNGITSKSTQLAQLGDDIVPDVKVELETIAEEQEQASNNGFNFASVGQEVTANGEDDLLATKVAESTAQSLQRE
ncbi:phage portal protein [Lactococcus laudensis]|uniref:Phage portal protein n=1 Tax=Pseudolactococcus laudensis TaxID=1494461 RepID=A0A7V8N240_9LACT|nr:phage portal protein [Lactococcus laudensis]MBA0017184.1 phage portal protein [Lactococcus laudensis]MBW9281883.1 phage portal protein [Lactococcus laudensis]